MLNTAFFIVGASSKLAGATAHGHVPPYPALVHDTIAIIRLRPHHSYNPCAPWHTHRFHYPAGRPWRLRSNPHSSSLPLRPQYRTAVSSLGASPTSALKPNRVCRAHSSWADIGQPLTIAEARRPEMVADNRPLVPAGYWQGAWGRTSGSFPI